ncbi:hypothetical protein IV203_003179 [Nitzschia inconspicua]|uniref:Uncharacterized protein n=1 Tax=Nitzschia inconspicua TaxID=303405 RepID=A0A9K3L1E0_9STRA|nr:hypothetical protein IV203_003179 [Nitzschia inconspicua]
MYLRDSQGRLRWFPPASQGLDPFADPGGHSYAYQQALIRQQLQHEEWMRFNAPPVGDRVHFDAGVPTGPRLPPMSMGHMISMQHEPGFFQTSQPPAFGLGAIPSPRANLDHLTPSPRAAVALAGGSPAQVKLPLSPRKIAQVSSSKTMNPVLPAAPNVSCMDTLFGSQVQHQYPNVSGIVACNQFDPPSDQGFDIKLPSHYNIDRFVDAARKISDESSSPRKLPNPMQIFQCNGIRGPPKKFDYSFKPKLPECHANTDIFYDALEEESPVSDPPVPEDILSVHDSFDDQTFLMDVVDKGAVQLPPRKKKSTPRKKVARKKTRQGEEPQEKKSPLRTVEETRKATSFEPFMEPREPEQSPSRDSIEQNRELTDSPIKNMLNTSLKIQSQPPVAPLQAIPKEILEPDIESEDSKDAMYASVTHRRNPDPFNVSQYYSGTLGIVSPMVAVQKIASREIVPSPETTPPVVASRDPPVAESLLQPMIPEQPPNEGGKSPSRSRSCKPKSRSKSKPRRSTSEKPSHHIDFNATDQAALAQSIREICLKATPELNGEDYPSFDEPKPKDGKLAACAARDSPDSETTGSSGAENEQQVANEKRRKKRRNKTEKSKRSSSVRPSSSRKEKPQSLLPNGNGITNNRKVQVFSERLQRLKGECKAWLPTEQN